MAPDAQSPAQARTESGALTLPPRPSRYDAEYDGTGPYRGRFGPRREREKGSVHSASGAQAALGTCFGSRGSQVRILSPRLDQHEPSSRMRRGFRWSWPRGDGIRTCTGVDEVRDGRTRSGRTLCGQAEPYGRGSHCSTTGSNPVSARASATDAGLPGQFLSATERVQGVQRKGHLDEATPGALSQVGWEDA